MKQMRKSTLEELGLGTVLDVFRNGKLPVDVEQAVTAVFGPPGDRGCMVISGANGVVGAGKLMQFAARLYPYGVPIVALDLAGAPDGIGKQFSGLRKAFGADQSAEIAKSIIQLNYDGKSLPSALKIYKPKFLLEAIPEKLELKKAHYALFRREYPDILIWSVTSGFPSEQLGVDIAHPAFPHEINKIFEIVEKKPGPTSALLWALGLIPVEVSDHWSFVLDVFFCGLMQASIRSSSMKNMPYWKTDKYIRKLVGPNPFRAHDAIGARGANFLTWSCLHHLYLQYGPLFEPVPELVERKDSGQNWYPPDHFRPLVNYSISDRERSELEDVVFGSLFQMTTIMLHERRASLPAMNAIGELCAQFTNGMLATLRNRGATAVLQTIERYHALHPEAAQTSWYPEELNRMSEVEWQQLYVNAEHDGKVGFIQISRESYNSDVDAELNRAMDWLLTQGIRRAILCGDFHLSTQMVGADTNEFFPALNEKSEGVRIAATWSATARRLHTDFDCTVGFINGKRCMGGMLELMMHCHYLFATDAVVLSMPEVTLPVVPGMEGCHWPFRKTNEAGRLQLAKMLLAGRPVKAAEALGWLVDRTGPQESLLGEAWNLVNGDESIATRRPFEHEALPPIRFGAIDGLDHSDAQLEQAREAIRTTIKEACGANLTDALRIQAEHSAAFMISALCHKGVVGAAWSKIASI
ncbi:MAG: hypothetical protein KBF37_05385 [Saprospiraceae bacterium]|jgi:enoyl-CoA hydratase/carnithine racemase/3-hydroxyacyl-CoA dehydrogenase|nr:hypothetical protein [Saprospiraceae bacterium]MBP9209742.1 hypothetical protein [Saprospiraceae bacterium]MBV6474083.1 Fatty acid oxidation complex subunit alpha [Saprospiraceae bacterium]